MLVFTKTSLLTVAEASVSMLSVVGSCVPKRNSSDDYYDYSQRPSFLNAFQSIGKWFLVVLLQLL